MQRGRLQAAGTGWRRLCFGADRRKRARYMIVPGQAILIKENPNQPQTSSQYADHASKQALVAAPMRWRVSIEVHQSHSSLPHADRIEACKGPQQLVKER